MLLLHITPNRNARNIRRNGMLTENSRGKCRVVWLHTPGRTEYLRAHLEASHGESFDDDAATIFLVDVPRRWLRRSGRNGIWKCVKNIPISRIKDQYP